MINLYVPTPEDNSASMRLSQAEPNHSEMPAKRRRIESKQQQRKETQKPLQTRVEHTESAAATTPNDSPKLSKRRQWVRSSGIYVVTEPSSSQNGTSDYNTIAYDSTHMSDHSPKPSSTASSGNQALHPYPSSQYPPGSYASSPSTSAHWPISSLYNPGATSKMNFCYGSNTTDGNHHLYNGSSLTSPHGAAPNKTPKLKSEVDILASDRTAPSHHILRASPKLNSDRVINNRHVLLPDPARSSRTRLPSADGYYMRPDVQQKWPVAPEERPQQLETNSRENHKFASIENRAIPHHPFRNISWSVRPIDYTHFESPGAFYSSPVLGQNSGLPQHPSHQSVMSSAHIHNSPQNHYPTLPPPPPPVTPLSTPLVMSIGQQPQERPSIVNKAIPQYHSGMTMDFPTPALYPSLEQARPQSSSSSDSQIVDREHDRADIYNQYRYGLNSPKLLDVSARFHSSSLPNRMTNVSERVVSASVSPQRQSLLTRARDESPLSHVSSSPSHIQLQQNPTGKTTPSTVLKRLRSSSGSLQQRRSIGHNLSLSELKLPDTEKSSSNTGSLLFTSSSREFTPDDNEFFDKRTGHDGETIDECCRKCGISASILVERTKIKEELTVKKKQWELYFSEDEAEKMRLNTEIDRLTDQKDEMRNVYESELKTQAEELRSQKEIVEDLKKKLELCQSQLKNAESALANTSVILNGHLSSTIDALSGAVVNSPPATSASSISESSELGNSKDELLERDNRVRSSTPVPTISFDKRSENSDLISGVSTKPDFEVKLGSDTMIPKTIIDPVMFRRSVTFTARSPLPFLNAKLSERLSKGGLPSSDTGSKQTARPGRKSIPRILFDGSNLKSMHVHRVGKFGVKSATISEPLDDPFGLCPKNVVPVIKDYTLGFREGIVDSRSKRLKRGVQVFKVGRKIPGELI
ncbi:hypothetical protein V1511DRAFT_510433 [Dipodascopsis uninucleata]